VAASGELAWIYFEPVGALYGCVAMIGGRDRDRTGDPLLAKQVLSQLSYTPTFSVTKDATAGCATFSQFFLTASPGMEANMPAR
jgi:hypothetical protein